MGKGIKAGWAVTVLYEKGGREKGILFADIADNLQRHIQGFLTTRVRAGGDERADHYG
jgi:hypothetical protein